MKEQDFSDRLSGIRERIAVASRRAGRSPAEVVLVAVSKRQPARVIEVALEAGLSDFGENYVQETLEKQGRLAPPRCRWHLIGHLQSNKAKAAVEAFDLIQSIDSVHLARRISKQATALGKKQRILLQVHLGDEATKTGLIPESVGEVAQEVFDLPGVDLQGLMGIAPQSECARPHFRLLRRLFDTLPAASQHVLSMGMTGDFEMAIEEGATMVRIGTALFGARQTEVVDETPT